MTMRLLFLIFAFLTSLAQAEEFLDPAVAFKPSARALDGQTVEISFAIAKGYYLYRDKFRVTVEGDAAALEARAIAADIRQLHDTAGVPWRGFGLLLRAGLRPGLLISGAMALGGSVLGLMLLRSLPVLQRALASGSLQLGSISGNTAYWGLPVAVALLPPGRSAMRSPTTWWGP